MFTYTYGTSQTRRRFFAGIAGVSAFVCLAGMSSIALGQGEQEHKPGKQEQEQPKVKWSDLNKSIDKYISDLDLKGARAAEVRSRLKTIVEAVYKDKGYVLYDP
ncbi:MAG: hypothetical protein GWN55_03565 [Phycisphaerae bacterium]|nr:hypothetical protein [candidate division KSB1 bacterium]NIV00401.1 hypothetical protein [Phycisphaerae bacterium]NIW68477.1 hypothetical protein [candidate division KSB1 bacterium]NIX70096.1 hypothetical protein [candidate division KSB1 bacterium]